MVALLSSYSLNWLNTPTLLTYKKSKILGRNTGTLTQRCSMTTHNTREGIEETEKVLWCVERMLDGTYKSAEHKKLDILNYLKRTLTTHHQELQKAREEERERIIYITKNIKDAFMSPLTERRWLQCIQFTDQPKPKDQSELDQPITSE